jgi:hypothetical protein
MTNTKENKIVAEYYTSLKTRQPSKLQQFKSIVHTKVRKWFTCRPQAIDYKPSRRRGL